MQNKLSDQGQNPVSSIMIIFEKKKGGISYEKRNQMTKEIFLGTLS